MPEVSATLALGIANFCLLLIVLGVVAAIGAKLHLSGSAARINPFAKKEGEMLDSVQQRGKGGSLPVINTPSGDDVQDGLESSSADLGVTFFPSTRRSYEKDSVTDSFQMRKPTGMRKPAGILSSSVTRTKVAGY
jgi:hypothetical protein